jgi:hypothetical protein
MRARDGVAEGDMVARLSRRRSGAAGQSCAELRTVMDGKEKDDGRVGRGLGNVPFEFVGEVARAGAVAEAGDVKRGTTAARHAVMEMGCLLVVCDRTRS